MSQTADEPVQYWYNLKTGQVEKGLKSSAIYRVGPFASAAEAARAPQIIEARAKAWRQEEAEES